MALSSIVIIGIQYPNDSLLKSLPSAVSVLIVWKPFSNKAAVKRILYVGSKCPIKRCFPTVIASLYGTYDFLKQADYVPCDGLAKKSGNCRAAMRPCWLIYIDSNHLITSIYSAPRKTTPPVSAGTKPKAGDNVAASTTGAPPTKKPATTTEKGGRPSTAAPHSSKEEP